MKNKEKALQIADFLRNVSGLRAYVTAEDILRRCASADELNWWYGMLMKERGK